ncbi:hypothetical protein KGA66_09330 [Actinocrinis puniceicyclus]|uniref:Uncharacterized protein n=1 Tax=Actinocrinis puniceicyclus TaxID=977794 RepID=A0A8J8BAR7_9ACTN|nr:hypothetical protein [Actinocrinis puniceicyclus]MBS2963247.1 hypothetical protein [Actinocrinis puniceicyclus]
MPLYSGSGIPTGTLNVIEKDLERACAKGGPTCSAYPAGDVADDVDALEHRLVTAQGPASMSMDEK